MSNGYFLRKYPFFLIIQKANVVQSWNVAERHLLDFCFIICYHEWNLIGMFWMVSKIMVSKFVIDGAPGSGKTTLLFGLTVDGETDKNIVCLKNFNFKIIPEAISTIADQMRKEGKVPTDAVDELVKRTINKAIEESSRDYKEVCFIERGLPGYFFMEDIFKIKLPKKYLEYQNILKYDSPIFILEPIYSFDMSKNNKQLRKGRVATLEQRKDIFQKTIEIYKKLGYEVEMVPNYDDDVKKNNRKRIEHILKFIPNNI